MATATPPLRMAVQSLAHSHNALGGYYCSMQAKPGAPEAVTAMAHKLALIIYAMLRNQTEYRDPGEGYYEERARQRAIKSLERKAKKIGLKVVPSEA